MKRRRREPIPAAPHHAHLTTGHYISAGTATMLVEYAEGATGTIDVSGTRMPGEGIDVDVRLHGDEGSLRLEFGLLGGQIKG